MAKRKDDREIELNFEDLANLTKKYRKFILAGSDSKAFNKDELKVLKLSWSLLLCQVREMNDEDGRHSALANAWHNVMWESADPIELEMGEHGKLQ